MQEGAKKVDRGFRQTGTFGVPDKICSQIPRGAMSFSQKDVDRLLAECGRMCCICKKLHQVQVHHIQPLSEGGSDGIANAITLCPNCHDEVHERSHYSSGCTSRRYSISELKLHREFTKKIARKEQDWAPGSRTWTEDRHLILFYAQCLDRPAFRTYFHQELSFADFDRALADTITAINTGCTKVGDSTLPISKGKVFLIHRDWREAMDTAVEKLEEIRDALRRELGLNNMFMDHDRFGRHHSRFHQTTDLGDWIDQTRQEILDSVNSILKELDQPPLKDLKAGF